MLRKKLKPIPRFKNYQEEIHFWHTHNLIEYVNSDRRMRALYSKNLDQGIKVRFSTEDLARLRKIAVKKGMGVTTFIRLKLLKSLDNNCEKVGG